MPESRKRKKKSDTTTAPVRTVPKEDQRSPQWWAPVMVGLMIFGLVWVVVTYLAEGRFPVPGIGNWNLAIGGVVALTGFLMTMRWK